MSTVTAIDDGYDLNNLHKSGDYFVADAQNGPYTGDFFVRVAEAKCKGLSTVFQNVVDLNTGSTSSRVNRGGTFTPWENALDHIIGMAPASSNLKFGPTMVGATSGVLMTADRMYFMRAFTTRPRTLTNLGLGITGNAAANAYFKCALYGSREDGLPGDLLGYTAELTGTTNGVFVSGAMNVPVDLIPGGLYWLAAHFATGLQVAGVTTQAVLNTLGYDTSGAIGNNMNKGTVRYALTYSSGLPDYLALFDGSNYYYSSSAPVVMGD